MVGYSESSKEYRIFEKATENIIIIRDVYFVEIGSESANNAKQRHKDEKKNVSLEIEEVAAFWAL